jgi:signal transduction histidine kinase
VPVDQSNRSACQIIDRLKTTFTGGGAFVEGDRVQLQQVVLNLILNAVESMGSVQDGPRELSISTEQTQANGVLVGVRDSGPGIDGKHLERVFLAFLHHEIQRSRDGAVDLPVDHRCSWWRLWIDANAPRGAVFQFTWPSVENELVNPAIR